ncbi:hypothetical protein [Nevskia sp.]|uniref:hypothetical protein n=1 Tax=Nevskia sp. TaxID=1929292 RepID=UPI0025DE2148|nr:hypothetical protein [Nevskia sp.]
MKRTWLLAVVAAAAAMAAHAAADPGAEIQLPPEVVRQSGIEAAAVAPISLPPRIAAFATVLDPAPLVQLTADIEILAATAAASQAEAARSERLLAGDASVSRRSSEAATAAAHIDAAKLAAARHRIALEWGSGLAALPGGERDRLLERVIDGKAALLRLSFTGPPPAQISASLDADDSHAALRLLGPTASRDPGIAGSSLLAISTQAGLQPGRVLAATVSGTARQGQWLPPEALLIDAQGRYVYVETGNGRYRRQPVLVLDERRGGVLVTGPGADVPIVFRQAVRLRWAMRAGSAD